MGSHEYAAITAKFLLLLECELPKWNRQVVLDHLAVQWCVLCLVSLFTPLPPVCSRCVFAPLPIARGSFYRPSPCVVVNRREFANQLAADGISADHAMEATINFFRSFMKGHAKPTKDVGFAAECVCVRSF